MHSNSVKLTLNLISGDNDVIAFVTQFGEYSKCLVGTKSSTIQTPEHQK